MADSIEKETNGKVKKHDPKNPSVFGRTEFFRMPEPEVKKTFVEVINASVYAKKMNAADKSSYDFSMMKFKEADKGEQKAEVDLTNLKCKYLVRVLCSSKGVRLFKDEEAPQLGLKQPEYIDGIHKAVQILLGDTSELAEKLEKNLIETPQDDSHSASA